MKVAPSFFLVLLASAAPAFAQVTVNSPSNGAVVSAPFSISASSLTCSSQPVSAMGYSLDNSSNSSVVYSASMAATVTATPGAHVLHVKSWGNRGAGCVTNVSITVQAPTVVSAPVQSVAVASPANNSSVMSPFPLSATALTCSKQPVVAMGYSLDSSTQTTIVRGTDVAAKVTSAAGAHTVHVKAWGNAGAVCVADVALNVTQPALATVPANAISVSNIQTLSNWKAEYDVVTGSGATGAMSLTSAASLSGNARMFATMFLNNGGERYHVSFGDDSGAANFLYDGWIYVDTSVNQVGNIEMDMNQTMANGETVIFGFQCDGWTGTWDYTANTGTPTAPVDSWIHSKQACNPRNWTINTWHHVQIAYSRDDAGNVTYKSVWLDNAQQDLNVTVPSSFALGWAPTLLTNFQVDGYGSSGAPTVYLDNLTVYRW